MGKITILFLVILLAGTLVLSAESIPTSYKTRNYLAIAPTPYPTISNPENYTVTEAENMSLQTSRNIEVLSPISNDSVKSGFAVKGNARVKDNTVVIRLSDASGKILTENTAIANSTFKGSYGPFENLVFFNSSDKSGKLDIFQFNSNDGTISDIVTIPLKFIK